MKVCLYDTEGVELDRGDLNVDDATLTGFNRKHKLSPKQVYCLRCYAVDDHEQHVPIRWKPVHRRDLLVRDIVYDPPPHRLLEDPEPPAGGRLRIKAHFRVDNDEVVSKVMRWQFEQRGEGEDSNVRTWRLPLHVKADPLRQISVVAAGVAAIVLAKLYELVVDSASGRDFHELPWLATFVSGLLLFVIAMIGMRMVDWGFSKSGD